MKLRYVMVFSTFLFTFVSGAAAQSPEQAKAIKEAALDYGEGWYEGNAERMERALHPELAKRMVFTNPKNGRSRLNQQGNALVTDLAVPFWQEAVKSGPMNDWSHYQLREPGGAASPHNFGAVTGFKEFADMAPGGLDFAGVFARAHPGKDIAQVLPKFQKIVTPVRQETWELIESINPAQ